MRGRSNGVGTFSLRRQTRADRFGRVEQEKNSARWVQQAGSRVHITNGGNRQATSAASWVEEQQGEDMSERQKACVTL